MPKKNEPRALVGAASPLTPAEEEADRLQAERIARLEAAGAPDLRRGETYEAWD